MVSSVFEYSLHDNCIGYLDGSVSNLPIVPTPEGCRIHPLDRKFNKLIRRKQKLFKQVVNNLLPERI